VGDAQECLLKNAMRKDEAHNAIALEGNPDPARIASSKPIDLAVILDARWGTPAIITALGDLGCRAVIWAADTPPALEILKAAGAFNLRILGPRTAGVFSVSAAINLTTLPVHPGGGQVALITQSQSIAAAAVDWAIGRSIGFSWAAVTGAEADVDVADLLDYAALDPATRAVILQVGRISNGRKFMSAARSAARIKPVLILQTSDSTVPMRSDPVRSAAFRRAGLVECESLGGLFDGLAALELLATPSGGRVTVVANGAGICSLAGNAVVGQGLMVAELSDLTRELITQKVVGARFISAGIDIGNVSADCLIAIARVLLNDAAVDSVMLVHSPLAGESQEIMAEELAKAALGNRVLTVWLGLHTALPARHSSARARLATFASVGDAARAVRYRLEHARTRELLMRTPPAEFYCSGDLEGVRSRCANILSAQGQIIVDDNAQELLAGYDLGFELAATSTPNFLVCAGRHHELGMWISIRQPHVRAPGAVSYGLPPLDPLLAQRMIEETGYDPDTTPGALEALSALLIRLGQLVADQPAVQSLVLPLLLGGKAQLQRTSGTSVEISAASPAVHCRLALAPYPKGLEHRMQTHNRKSYLVRAVQPSDEPGLLDLLGRLNPQEVRLRFFSYIRHFSHDMAARMTQIDYDRELTLVAVDQAQRDVVAGIATLVSDPDGREAEYAVLVHHDHARQGIGRHLLEFLLREARERGISKVHGDVLAYNMPMLQLAHSLGFSVQVTPDDPGCRQVEIVLAPSPERQSA
jgi:acyl-CoA synthetase (NDP forming)/GNAT superfamily N-acetyltransferase